MALLNADLSSLALSTGSNGAALTSALSAVGLALARTQTTAGMCTAQTSASTLVTGINANDPRVEDRGAGRGLLIEFEAQNLIGYSRDNTNGGWTAGNGATSTSNYTTGPDGASLAERDVTTASGQWGRYWQLASNPANGVHSASQWQRATSGTKESAFTVYVYGSSTAHCHVDTSTSTTWRRVDIAYTQAGASTVEVYPVESSTPGTHDNATDIVHDFHQAEAGAVPTSIIVNANGTLCVRGRDILTAAIADVVVSGRVRYELKFIALAASSAITDPVLVNARDTTNDSSVRRNTSANTYTVKINGTDVVTSSASAMSWAAGDVVEFFVEYGNGATYLYGRVNGGARVTIISDATSRASIATGGTSAEFFGLRANVKTYVLPCLAQTIRGYAGTDVPGWVTASGAAAITLGAATSSAAGTVSGSSGASGALASTLEASSSSAAGTVLVAGASSVTLEAATSSSSGTVAVVGASSTTLEAATLSAAAVAGSGGALASTLAAATAAAAGVLLIAGALASTLEASSSSAAGTVLVAGASSATLEAATSSSSGTVAVAGASSATLEAATLSSAGGGPATFGIGVGAASQELNARSHSGSFTETTFGTDSTVSSVDTGTDVITATAAHAMITGDGPFRFTSSGTLPAGLATATDYYVIVTSTTAYRVATTAQNAIAGTGVDLTSSGSGTHTLVRTVDTQASGSLFLVASMKGAWSSAPSTLPTDNKANTYALLGSVHAYSGYPAASTAVHYAFGSGGADHTWSATGADFDEVTVAALEVQGASVIQDHSHVERASGSATVTSASVTTTAPAWLVAICCGTGPVGQDHTFTPGAGWTKQPSASREADMHPDGYIQVVFATKYEATPGTFTVDWSGTANEGAQLYLIAVQDRAGALGTSTSTLGAATSSATGVVARTGASSSTLAAATSSSSGTVLVAGASSSTLEAATSSASGTVASSTSGSVTSTLGAASSSSSGTVTVAGSLTSTLGAATVASSGTAPGSGALASTLAAATSSSSGTVLVAGASSSTLEGATVASSGTAPSSGALASTLAAASSSSSGTVAVVGALAASLKASSSAASGLVTDGAIILLDDATAAASGTVAVSGSASLSTTSTVASSGTVAVVGASSSTLAAATSSATATSGWGVIGAAAVTLGAASSSSSGTALVAGALASTLADATSAGPLVSRRATESPTPRKSINATTLERVGSLSPRDCAAEALAKLLEERFRFRVSGRGYENEDRIGGIEPAAIFRKWSREWNPEAPPCVVMTDRSQGKLDDFDPEFDDQTFDEDRDLALRSTETSGEFAVDFYAVDEPERRAIAAALPGLFVGEDARGGSAILLPIDPELLPPAFRQHADRYRVRIEVDAWGRNVDEQVAAETREFRLTWFVSWTCDAPVVEEVARMDVISRRLELLEPGDLSDLPDPDLEA